MDDNRVGYWLAKAVTRSFAMTHKASALHAEAEEAIKTARRMREYLTPILERMAASTTALSIDWRYLLIKFGSFCAIRSSIGVRYSLIRRAVLIASSASACNALALWVIAKDRVTALANQ